MRWIGGALLPGGGLDRLFPKIFLWFCATVLVTLGVVFLMAAITATQPFGRRWMSLTQDLYARSAVDFYRTGGPEGLARYTKTLAANSRIHGQLLDATGRDLLGADVPVDVRQVLLQSERTGESALRVGRVWTAASPVAYDGERYTFVMEVFPMQGFVNGAFAMPLLPKALLGLVLVALFCFLLARHITDPIRVLEEAATELAAGSLNVRAGPRIGMRKDELGRMAAAFDEMAARIQDLIYGQQEMLGHISHELRSPLTRIGVSLELMRRGEMESIEQAEGDLERMNRMIGDILLITRMDLQSHRREAREGWGRVDLLEVLEGLAQDAAFEAQDSERLVTFSGEAGCVVWGDESMIRSGCENVVRNALLYAPEGKEIRIGLVCEQREGRAVVSMRDEGPGVPAEALPRLFDLFYRVDGVTGRHPEGSGLGLAIAQKIVLAHGGTIEARNVEPTGLEVRIVFPLVDGLVTRGLS